MLVHKETGIAPRGEIHQIFCTSTNTNFKTRSECAFVFNVSRKFFFSKQQCQQAQVNTNCQKKFQQFLAHYRLCCFPLQSGKNWYTRFFKGSIYSLTAIAPGRKKLSHTYWHWLEFIPLCPISMFGINHVFLFLITKKKSMRDVSNSNVWVFFSLEPKWAKNQWG